MPRWFAKEDIKINGTWLWLNYQRGKQKYFAKQARVQRASQGDVEEMENFLLEVKNQTRKG